MKTRFVMIVMIFFVAVLGGVFDLPTVEKNSLLVIAGFMALAGAADELLNRKRNDK